MNRLEREHLSHPDRFPDYTERVREQLAFPGMAESFASTFANFTWDAGGQWPEVGRHARPVLVVWGTDDTVTPYRNHHEVMRLYPRARLLAVDGAKHAPHLDHAHIVHPAVVTHLTSGPR
jgi:pimeloyl-ACP methyl ester carboxylesterase